MRVVYSDESGVGSRQQEPITVVTAIALNMDDQWADFNRALAKIKLDMPKNLLEKGQAFKGKILYGAVRKGIAEAAKCLEDIFNVIDVLGLPVFYGAVDRDGFDRYRNSKTIGHDKDIDAYGKAFEACLMRVDGAIRTLTKESVLWVAHRSDREREPLTTETLTWHRLRNKMKVLHGRLPVAGGRTRIADTIYFGNDLDSLPLQIADVCCSTVCLHLLEEHYRWKRCAGHYYEILRPHIINDGTPVMFSS